MTRRMYDGCHNEKFNEVAKKIQRQSASTSNDLLDCKCGAPAKSWYEGNWNFTGCRCCGKAAAAYKNIQQSEKDWNKMAATMKVSGA